MRKFYQIIILVIFRLSCFDEAFAGNDGFSFGPRALGTGQIGGLFSDIWAIQNNIGALGYLKNGGIGVSFENRYNLSAFNQIALSAATSEKNWGVAGFGTSRFGSDLFNQTRVQAGWAKAFGIASIGLQAQYYQVAAADFPTRQYFLLNFGGLARLTPKLHFSGSISNLTQTKASEFQEERIPTIVKAGLMFLPNQKIRLMTEIQKDLDQKALFKAGLEYEVREKFWIRTGFTSQTMQACGGLGLEWRNLVFDYAFSSHPQLGWSNSIGINFIFKNSKSEPSTSK